MKKNQPTLFNFFKKKPNNNDPPENFTNQTNTPVKKQISKEDLERYEKNRKEALEKQKKTSSQTQKSKESKFFSSPQKLDQSSPQQNITPPPLHNRKRKLESPEKIEQKIPINSPIKKQVFIQKVNNQKEEKKEENSAKKTKIDQIVKKEKKEEYKEKITLKLDENKKESPLKKKNLTEKSKFKIALDNTLEEDPKNDKTPPFLIDLKDANMNPPDSPHYDPTTLYIPQKDYNQLSSTRKQYWDVKKNNFDKIVAIQIGSFYELFYNDAELGNKLFGLKIHTAHSGNFFIF
jgi:hypothetical protein